MRILQTGTYSSRNKGDAAMQLSAARAIRERFGEASVTVSAPFSEVDAPFYAPIPVVACGRRRLIRATFRLARAWLWGFIRRRLGADCRFLVADAESRAYLDSDIVLDLSGDMLTEDYGPHVAYSHFLPILMGLALGKPVYLCAQSIGPFRFTKPLARFILNRAARITARDPITEDYLKGLGLRREPPQLTADLAFLLEPAASERVDDILRTEGIEPWTEPVLGVSVSCLVKSAYAKGARRANGVTFASLMSQVLDVFQEETGARVMFVSHVTGPAPSKDDRLIARDIRRQMSRPAWLIEGDYRPEEIKGLIGRCALFLGARMHANIAALSSRVPVVAIAYSHKTPGIMESLGMAEYVCRAEALSRDALLGKLRDLYAGRQDLAERLGDRVASTRRRAVVNIDLIETLKGNLS